MSLNVSSLCLPILGALFLVVLLVTYSTPLATAGNLPLATSLGTAGTLLPVACHPLATAIPHLPFVFRLAQDPFAPCSREPVALNL
jgi:hypothetical protein